MQLTVRAESNSIGVGERLLITLNVLAEPGVDIVMPRIENELGVFEIVYAATPPDIPEADRRLWQHQYTLRIFEAGEHEILLPPIQFHDRRSEQADDETISSELAPEPLMIAVRSLHEGELDSAAIREIKGEVDVDLPIDWKKWAIIAAVIAVLLAAIVAIIALLKKMRKPAPPPPPPLPHVWAMQQLDALAAERLIARSEWHEYYFRLSDIVRRYIELRFGIMAAEQTTEEFLCEARRHSSLNESHRAMLTHFLRQADMVKFAKLQPAERDCDAALDAAKTFVTETATRPDQSSMSESANVASPSRREMEPIA